MGSPRVMTKQPTGMNSFTLRRNANCSTELFQFGVKQGEADCPSTFIKKQKTIQAMVSTTYPDGTQKKGKEDVPEEYFVGKAEAKKLSSAATQQSTEVLRTEPETDNEADNTDGGMSGIACLDTTGDTAGSEPKEETIKEDDSSNEVKIEEHMYWIQIDGIVVGKCNIINIFKRPSKPNKKHRRDIINS